MTTAEDMVLGVLAVVTTLLIAALVYATFQLHVMHDLTGRLAVVCVTGSPARLDLSDMAAICRDAIGESVRSK